MKNWPDIHQAQAERERRALVDDEVPSIEKFALGAKEKRYEPGSIWLWSLGAVYGPIGSQQEKAA